MAEPFRSEIRIFSFNFAPKGWAHCDGQLLPINQNQALFALLGTTFGGDGRITFALPNLQARAPIHTGNQHTLGESGGQSAHSLTIGEAPTHTHSINASSDQGNNVIPTGNVLASPLNATYRAPGPGASTMDLGSLTGVGGSQAHENMQPYLVLTFGIALQGIFPSRS